MFFVLNPGRSGSQTISEVLSQAPDCECRHEPSPEFVAEAPRYFYGELDEQEVVSALTASRSPTVEGKVYGESANKLSLMIPALVKAFPEAQLVWLVRDGRGFVCSGLQRGWYGEQELTEPANDWQRWRLRGDLSGDMTEEHWNALSRFERICWLWAFMNRVIEREIRRFRGEDFALVRIEQLGHVLLHLCEWLGIQPATFVIDRTNRRERAEVAPKGTRSTNIVKDVLSWEAWSDSERASFTRWCGDLMDRFYPGWRDPDGTWHPVEKEVGPGDTPRVFEPPRGPTLYRRVRRKCGRAKRATERELRHTLGSLYDRLPTRREVRLSIHRKHRALARTFPFHHLSVIAQRREYARRGLAGREDSFVLYRILGNDLVPRHREGQTLDNLRFILDNEPTLPGCEKRWVVNRVVNARQESAILSLLRERNQKFIHIPFHEKQYRRVELNVDGFPSPDFLISEAFLGLGQNRQERALDHAYHDKNRYVMNNNGSRNTALREGRTLAKWVLPWDGNCFLTAAAWAEISREVRSAPWRKYFIVPMTRCTENQQLLETGFEPNPVEEPQIIFRCDAGESFDENMRYGRRPKVDLLWRLDVPGPWDEWRSDPWDPPRAKRSREARHFNTTGWVARLSSGMPALEVDQPGVVRDRGIARRQAVRSMIDGIDERLARKSFRRERLGAYDEFTLLDQREQWRRGDRVLGRVVNQLISAAEERLAHAPVSVVHKTTVAPSGDKHDYWHPAPYWWPNLDTLNGLPYVWRDGQRIPGTRMYEPESDKYDRTRLQIMFENTTILALAWYFTGEMKFAEHAATILRTWFVDPETRMNPHLKYAQVRMGHNDNEGANTGVIEAKDFYFLLDAVRLLHRSGAWTDDDERTMLEWSREFLDWLITSAQGRAECCMDNNHGTCYDLQVGALAAYVDDVPTLVQAVHRARMRIRQQIEPDGRQPNELDRSNALHYCAFNLHCWANLAHLTDAIAADLWTYRTEDDRSLFEAFRWLVPHLHRSWPHGQDATFDMDRLLPLYYIAERRFPGPPPDLDGAIPGRYEVKPMFHPHSGIRPYWSLGFETMRDDEMRTAQRKRIDELEKRLRRARRDAEALESSRSYRVGRAVTRPAKTVGRVVRSLRRRSPEPPPPTEQAKGAQPPARPAAASPAKPHPTLSIPPGRHVSEPRPESLKRVMIVVVGLGPEDVERCIEAVIREQLIVGGFAPLFVTDCDDFQLFGRHDFLFEYIPPPDSDADDRDPTRRSAYLQRRMRSILDDYQPQRVIVFDDASRASGFRSGVIDTLLADPPDTAAT